MKLEKAIKRDGKRHKKQHGMVISNKSIFTFDRVSNGLQKKKKRKAKLVLDNE